MSRALLLFFLFFGVTVHAYQPQFAEPTQPFEVIPVSNNLSVQHDFLGELTGFPEMYEIQAEENFTLSVSVQQRKVKEPAPFSLIVVRQDPETGRVSEVTRFSPSSDEWQQEGSSLLGMTFLTSGELWEAVEAGVYHIEISTPTNEGAYLLSFGEERQSTGYFATISNIWQTQQHFGLSPVSIVLSYYVYLPLLVLVSIIGAGYYWRRKQTITHDS